jgi:TatA/E family protein of Tat protein translocase
MTSAVTWTVYCCHQAQPTRPWDRKGELLCLTVYLQPMHLIVIQFIALMVFEPKKLLELGKGLGDGIGSFKDSMRNKKTS